MKPRGSPSRKDLVLFSEGQLARMSRDELLFAAARLGYGGYGLTETDLLAEIQRRQSELVARARSSTVEARLLVLEDAHANTERHVARLGRIVGELVEVVRGERRYFSQTVVEDAHFYRKVT